MKDSEIKALAEKGHYLGRPLAGKLEQTHISWIIITQEYAFKVKKPVKMSFLDFSSLSQRKKFCKKELILNQRFSRIYLDVVAVWEEQGHWELGAGKGRIKDYAVRMRRMNSGKRMDRVVGKGKADSGHMLALARQIARFHQKAAPVKHRFNSKEISGTFDDLKSIYLIASEQMGREFTAIIDQSLVVNKVFLTAHTNRFRERIRLGFQRDVHGDLHCGNIFLYREPVIFDCIEFNARYRQIDVLSEIAFLCMDLEFYGQYSLSEIFVYQYCDLFPCFQTAEDNLLFIYYKLARANVRAKVHALNAMESGDKVELESARKYLLLMKTYMGQLNL